MFNFFKNKSKSKYNINDIVSLKHYRVKNNYKKAKVLMINYPLLALSLNYCSHCCSEIIILNEETKCQIAGGPVDGWGQEPWRLNDD